jgi:hypothetical protein
MQSRQNVEFCLHEDGCVQIMPPPPLVADHVEEIPLATLGGELKARSGPCVGSNGHDAHASSTDHRQVHLVLGGSDDRVCVTLDPNDSFSTVLAMCRTLFPTKGALCSHSG